MKNTKNIKLRAAILVNVILMAACGDPIGDYYNGGSEDEDGIHTGLSVLEYLQSNPDYSEFVSLLESTGQIEELRSGNLITVLAPVNSSLPASVASMTDMELELMMGNHLCLTTLYTRNLSRMDMVRTLAGKALDVVHTGGEYLVDGVKLDRTDVVCTDGVIHSVSQWLVPRLNLLQWLTDLPDTYSIFRDSLLAYNSYVFDKEHSEIIGVDDDGRVVYDSIWIVNNWLLNDADLGNEQIRYTMMAPSNEVFENLYTYQTEYLEGVGRPVTPKDTVAWVHWIMEASLYEGVWDFEESGNTYSSVKGRQLRTDYNEVDETVSMSNGRVYKMKKCYVPKSLHLTEVVYNPYFPRRKRMVKPQNDKCYANTWGGTGTYVPATHDNPLIEQVEGTDFYYDRYHVVPNNMNCRFDNVNHCLYVQYGANAGDEVCGYIFTSSVAEWEADPTATDTGGIRVDSISPLNVMPGRYNIKIKLMDNHNGGSGNKTNVVNLYKVVQHYGFINGVNQYNKANDIFISSIEGITVNKTYITGKEPVASNVVFNMDDDGANGKYAPVTMCLRVPGEVNGSDGTVRRFIVGQVTLTPTNDNY